MRQISIGQTGVKATMVREDLQPLNVLLKEELRLWSGQRLGGPSSRHIPPAPGLRVRKLVLHDEKGNGFSGTCCWRLRMETQQQILARLDEVGGCSPP